MPHLQCKRDIVLPNSRQEGREVYEPVNPVVHHNGVKMFCVHHISIHIWPYTNEAEQESKLKTIFPRA